MVNVFVVAMLMYNSEVLLLHRAHTSFGNNQYCLVGGKVEEGERGLKAMQREILEEVGLTILENEFELIHTLHRKGTETEFIALCFKADISHYPAPVNKEPSKHDEMRFFALDQLPETLLPAHRQMIELSQKNVRYSEHNWK